MNKIMSCLVLVSPFLVSASAQNTGSSYESFNYRGEYIRHQNSLAEKTPIVSELDRKDATFNEVRGLAGECISFESVNYPGRFLRHKDGRIRLDAPDGSQTFAGDATFCMLRAPVSDAFKGIPPRTRVVSFMSLNRPGYYLRHAYGHMILDKITDDLSKADVTFIARPGLWQEGAAPPNTASTPPAVTNAGAIAIIPPSSAQIQRRKPTAEDLDATLAHIRDLEPLRGQSLQTGSAHTPVDRIIVILNDAVATARADRADPNRVTPYPTLNDLIGVQLRYGDLQSAARVKAEELRRSPGDHSAELAALAREWQILDQVFAVVYYAAPMQNALARDLQAQAQQATEAQARREAEAQARREAEARARREAEAAASAAEANRTSTCAATAGSGPNVECMQLVNGSSGLTMRVGNPSIAECLETVTVIKGDVGAPVTRDCRVLPSLTSFVRTASFPVDLPPGGSTVLAMVQRDAKVAGSWTSLRLKLRLPVEIGSLSGSVEMRVNLGAPNYLDRMQLRGGGAQRVEDVPFSGLSPFTEWKSAALPGLTFRARLEGGFRIVELR